MMPPVFSDAFRDELDRLLRWRRDVRRFRRDALAPRLVPLLLDLADRAPSVGNAQPTRFVRVLSPALRRAVAEHVEAENAAAAADQPDDRRAAYRALKLHGLREAPEHIAVFCDEGTADGAGLGRRTMPETLRYSTVLAIHTLWLAARAHGVGLGWVSILRPADIAALLDVPARWSLIGYLCLGYPEEEHEVPELARHGWQAHLGPERTRFER